MKKKIHIVGAGISGLSLANLIADEFEVHVYDKNDVPGGLIRTIKTEYGIVETAANSILLNQKVKAFFESMNISLIAPLPQSRKRFLYRNSLTRWPITIIESMAFIGRILFHLLTRKAFLKPKNNESLKAWGARTLGNAASKWILAPAMQGIYAGDFENLSASLIIGPLFAKNRSKSLGIYSGANGMFDVVSALHARAKANGVHFHFNSTFSSSNRDENEPLIIATSAKDAALALSEIAPTLSRQLNQIPMNSLVTTTSFYREKKTKFVGFGALIPRNLGFRTLGILINSYIFPGRDKYYNETIIMGGYSEGSIVNLDEQEIKQIIKDEREKIMGDNEQPLKSVTTKWDHALPHYSLELESILKNLVIPQNVFLHGNYLGGIGISKIIERSLHLAEELRALK